MNELWWQAQNNYVTKASSWTNLAEWMNLCYKLKTVEEIELNEGIVETNSKLINKSNWMKALSYKP